MKFLGGVFWGDLNPHPEILLHRPLYQHLVGGAASHLVEIYTLLECCQVNNRCFMSLQQLTDQSCLCSNNILSIHFIIAFTISAQK